MKPVGSLLLILVLCLSLLSGCGGPRELHDTVEDFVEQTGQEGGIGYNDVDYDHPETYTVGGGEITDPVKRVEIDWYGGSVTVGRHEKDTVSFQENAGDTLPEEFTLRYRVKEGTLSLVYSAPGRLKLGNLKKDLTVLLPQDLALEELEIDTGSAPVTVSDLATREISVDTASGTVELLGCQVTDRVSVDTGSGNVKAALTGTLRALSADTASGDITVTAGEITQVEGDTASGSIQITADTLGSVETDTASGDVEITAQAVDEVEVDAASGSLTLTTDQAPREIQVDTASGQITLNLPETASFTATVDTISGKWRCELPTTMDGDRYTCGSGTGRYSFSTASGDVTIHTIIL